VEHKLFSYISINWAGKPLRSFETMLDYIRGTTTETGLQVEAHLIEHNYAKGIKVSDEDMARLNIERPPICPDWNYTLKPRPLKAYPHWLFNTIRALLSVSNCQPLKPSNSDRLKFSPESPATLCFTNHSLFTTSSLSGATRPGNR
jgi:hypothetical protein